jgi:hypothetical protein
VDGALRVEGQSEKRPADVGVSGILCAGNLWVTL